MTFSACPPNSAQKAFAMRALFALPDLGGDEKANCFAFVAESKGGMSRPSEHEPGSRKFSAENYM